MNNCVSRYSAIALTVVAMSTAAQVKAATFTVEIRDFSFQPASLTVQDGDIVRWIQRDSAAHNSVSDTDLWSGPLLSYGQSYSFTFNSQGTFPYHCAPHPFMKGTITVKAAANTPPSVSIAAPVSGAKFPAGSKLNLLATATDTDGSVVKVEFFSGTTLLGTIAASPFALSVSNLTSGSYVLTAKATDNSGATTTSASVTVVIAEPINISNINPVESGLVISWTGGVGPFALQKKTRISDADWANAETTTARTATVQVEGKSGFFRVLDQGQTAATDFTAQSSGHQDSPIQ